MKAELPLAVSVTAANADEKKAIGPLIATAKETLGLPIEIVLSLILMNAMAIGKIRNNIDSIRSLTQSHKMARAWARSALDECQATARSRACLDAQSKRKLEATLEANEKNTMQFSIDKYRIKYMLNLDVGLRPNVMRRSGRMLCGN